VQLLSDWLQPACQLIWADFLPACHAKKSQNSGVNKNIGACQDFTDFYQTLEVNIYAPRRPIKKWSKQKVITITVQYQFCY
jgi:hypothetical protein